MANGELCKNCGYQETDHVLGYAKSDDQECAGFASVVMHHPDCPVLGCDSNCASTIAEADFALKAAHSRASVILVLTPYATFMYGN